jgi:hypothetical protein
MSAPVRASDLVSAADIASRLGVATNTVTQWHHRGLLPPPVALVERRTMRLWSWEAVETWAQSTGRLSRVAAGAEAVESPAPTVEIVGGDRAP